ncbi:MAG: hypothetical protein CMP76_05855 [Flavobacterium sp.]|uniref:hypothetical protein n=1 Tax=Flavobacterium sp. TaxID=239 RepID=UPI000C3A5FB8|nr:hypothetical protein [Flavobacterium sp.]MBF02803.1 hypothetical protein [Flavobacterium sp.]|tara:strand:+ start:1077 stop:1601 length:525 start_codon:yes stop_codon:yes gene_type:complete
MKRASLLLLLLVLISCTSKKENTTETTPENNTQQDTVKVTEAIVPEENSTTENNDNSTEITNEDYYICYTDDDVPTRVIWIRFAKDGKAQQVKYKGQKEAINVVFVSEETSEGGAHPTIESNYDEIYNGTKNGTYTLTHSGVWDYVTYTREKDQKQFHFTIDHEADPYGKEPCF